MLPQNRTIFTADNLPVMRGIDSNCIDLIYLDPPFNSNDTYGAPIGSAAAGAFFKDIWTLKDTDNEWHGAISELYPKLYEAIRSSEYTFNQSMKAYLIAMAMRLIEMKRILKPTGSIYYHCDPTASHYIKIMMDSIFEAKNFRNEIVWCYRGGGVPKDAFARKHDILFSYSQSKDRVHNKQYTEYSESSKKLVESRGGTSIDGKKRDLNRGASMPDWWSDINSLQTWSTERTGYPTQKPLKLLDRIIKASSNPGDLVLDPFCGCATTCIAAENINRKWIGIDISPKATELVDMRLKKEVGFFSTLSTHTDEIPKPMPDSTHFDMLSSDEMPLVEIEPFRRTKTDEWIENQKDHYRSRAYYKRQLYGEQNGCCNGCEIGLPIHNLEIDHIKPKVRGGGHEKENLQLLCSHCNSVKSDGTHEQLIQKLKEKSII